MSLTMRRCRTAGRRSVRTHSAACAVASNVATGSQPSAALYRRPGRSRSIVSTQPSGERTLIPMPLSSHTNRIGTRVPEWSNQPAVFSPASAAAWLTEASPNEQTTIASGGHEPAADAPRGVRDRRPATCWIAYANPTARGRCEAIVEVVGMMARLGCPKTLCRPPAIGSVDAATTPRNTSRIGSVPPTWAARAQ
jgi:hypothetical protein